VVVNGQAEVDIGGGDGERLLQILETLNGCEALDELFEAIVGGEAEPGRGPATEIGELGFVGDALHHFERRASAVGCSDESTDAGASHDVDGDGRFAQDSQDADVGNASGETAGEGDSNAGALGSPWSATVSEGTKDVLGNTEKVLRVAVFLCGHIRLFYDAGSLPNRRLTRTMPFCNLFCCPNLTVEGIPS